MERNAIASKRPSSKPHTKMYKLIDNLAKYICMNIYPDVTRVLPQLQASKPAMCIYYGHGSIIIN